MIQFENAVQRYGKIILNEMKEADIKCWLAGGALRDYFMGVPVKTDYDMFFPNEIEYEKALTYFKARDCEIKWESDNGCKMKYKDCTYDLVKKFLQTLKQQLGLSILQFRCLLLTKKKYTTGKLHLLTLQKGS